MILEVSPGSRSEHPRNAKNTCGTIYQIRTQTRSQEAFAMRLKILQMNTEKEDKRYKNRRKTNSTKVQVKSLMLKSQIKTTST